MEIDRDRVHAALAALSEQLHVAGERYELVVIGGSGLLALGLIDRITATSTSSRSGATAS